MIRIVSEPSKVEEIQGRLHDRLLAESSRSGTLTVQHPGGYQDEPVHYISDLDFWYAYHLADNRYWNSFGLGDPFQQDGAISIDAEINPPTEEHNRRIAGAVGITDDSEAVLLHRGIFSGLLKEDFFKLYRGAIVEVEDVDRHSEVALVANLGSSRALSHVRAFVASVRHLKDIPKDDRPSASKAKESALCDDFTLEFEGTATQSARDEAVAECDHGTVVNSLQETLASEHTVGNDQFRDLYLLDEDGEMQVLFEVKSQAVRYEIYRAIGQLLYHAPPDGSVEQVLLLPESVPTIVRKRVRRRGFVIVTYGWENGVPIFSGLSRIA